MIQFLSFKISDNEKKFKFHIYASCFGDNFKDGGDCQTPWFQCWETWFQSKILHSISTTISLNFYLLLIIHNFCSTISTCYLLFTTFAQFSVLFLLNFYSHTYSHSSFYSQQCVGAVLCWIILRFAHAVEAPRSHSR